ncbi:7491_t:CDS:2, partial [Dentiscutata heterogama]
SQNIITVESQEKWTEDELVEFEEVRTRLLNSSLWSTENLRIRLEELNQRCSIEKSVKKNSKIFTYDYLRFLSIHRYIQLLLEGQGKMDAANQIACFIWNKGSYMAKCVWIWGNHYIKTGELLPYRQGKHTKLESLIDDEDFSENWEKEYVQIIHDECYFYANDGRRRIWIQKGKNILCPKHLGRSIMLYKNLYIKDKETFVIHSVQMDGYWKVEHMLDQL